MHDRFGCELKEGDEVCIVAKIVSVSPSEEFCNVTVETKHGRRPDGLKEMISGINTAVMVKLHS